MFEQITVVPHCWQDNVSLRMNLAFPTHTDSVRHLVVYDFHPIHVFLNTEHLDRYEGTRRLHQMPDTRCSNSALEHQRRSHDPVGLCAKLGWEVCNGHTPFGGELMFLRF